MSPYLELWRHPCNSIATHSSLPLQPRWKSELCRPFLESLLSRGFRNDAAVAFACSRIYLEAAGELEESFSTNSASLRSTNHRRVRYECENHQSTSSGRGLQWLSSPYRHLLIRTFHAKMVGLDLAVSRAQQKRRICSRPRWKPPSRRFWKSSTRK